MARKVSGGAVARQSAGADRGASGGRAVVAGHRVAPILAGFLTAALATAACDADRAGREPAEAGAIALPSESRRVHLGIDVLLRDSVGILEGRRVGLITNHTGLSWPDSSSAAPTGSEGGVSTIDRLHHHPGIRLVALFGPEHGIRGLAGAGQAVEDGVDPATQLPIHSLYGEHRKPTAAMLDGIDVLVFDIQDIGARYYTYVWTMALAMEAAGEHDVEFVVLDRPNPLGGTHVQGNVLDPAFATFVGLYPVPMRHGLTVGELALMLAGEYGVAVDLTVVPMDGWTRSMGYVQTGLPFVPPSPNMPSVASATHYPGTCLFEGTNLSVGRGTDTPFQWIGAPWLDAEAVADRLNAMARDRITAPAGAATESLLAGFYVEATQFSPEDPGDGKYAGREVNAVRFNMTDPRYYDPTRAAVATLAVIRELHPDRLEWNAAHFDRLAGTDELRQGILSGESVSQLTAEWPRQRAAFERRREPYLLYR